MFQSDERHAVSITSNTSSMHLLKNAARKKTPRLFCEAYTFRLYPTKQQVSKLEWTLRRCKELYNAALQERREAYRLCGVSVSYRMQADQLPAIKQRVSWSTDMGYWCLKSSTSST
jgi:helix-turn-helix protein